MSHAIFLRAVNVGGHQGVSVAALAKKLGLVNVGAAGTFVAHKGSVERLRASIAKELPFQTEIMIVPGAEITALVASDPFKGASGKPYVTVLAGLPKAPPRFPLDGNGIRFLGLDGRFLLSEVLPDAKPGTAGPGTMEKTLGVSGTARGWPTILRVAKAIADAGFL